ncbi:MAG TPA: PTS sugar transporter subunit IIC [Gemmatimonadaceae bacterium]|nr:PTS sugar transporter subunit IIC [Gemmatimonadaceae bacterium]
MERADVVLPSFIDLLPVALLGAVLGLDVVSFPQAMVSRPIVAATLAGALVGAPAAGLLVGATLELVAIETLPFGASRYPEWGSAAVVGGVVFASQPGERAGALLVAVVAALLTAGIGGRTMVWLRRLNARLAHARGQALEHGSGRTVVGLQLLGMTADLVRGALLTLLAVWLLQPLAALVLARWSLPEPLSRVAVVMAVGAVAAGAAWKLFHAVRRARQLFVAGLLGGTVILLLRVV